MTSKKLSTQKVEEYKQTFKMFDVDGDGKITQKQLKQVMKKFNISSSQQEVKKMMSHIDTDGNGTIELKEFMVFVQNQSDQIDEQSQMRQAFQMFDKDNNGLITKQELRQGLAKLGQKMNHKEINDLVEAVDLDGDGQINYEEFQELMKFNSI